MSLGRLKCEMWFDKVMLNLDRCMKNAIRHMEQIGYCISLNYA